MRLKSCMLSISYIEIEVKLNKMHEKSKILEVQSNKIFNKKIVKA